MTLFIKIIFILSCEVFIFNLPESHGIQNPGYHVSTLSEELTPSERFIYIFFRTLPNRIYYSYEKHCYIVRGQTVHYQNDLRRKSDGKRYKVMPRWQYYLSKLSPMNLIQSGLEYVSIAKSILGGGGLGDYADADLDGFADGDGDDGIDVGADDPDDSKKEPGLLSKGVDMGKDMMSPPLNLFGGSNDANNNNEKKDGDNGKNDEKKNEEPGFLSKGMGMGKDLMSPVFNFFGGSNDANNNNNNEKKNDPKDDKEGDKPAESESYMDMAKNALDSPAVEVAKEVLESDAAKDAVKTGISLFVPGGPAIVAAMDGMQKYNEAHATVDKVEDKIPKLK